MDELIYVDSLPNCQNATGLVDWISLNNLMGMARLFSPFFCREKDLRDECYHHLLCEGREVSGLLDVSRFGWVPQCPEERVVRFGLFPEVVFVRGLVCLPKLRKFVIEIPLES